MISGAVSFDNACCCFWQITIKLLRFSSSSSSPHINIIIIIGLILSSQKLLCYHESGDRLEHSCYYNQFQANYIRSPTNLTNFLTRTFKLNSVNLVENLFRKYSNCFNAKNFIDMIQQYNFVPIVMML